MGYDGPSSVLVLKHENDTVHYCTAFSQEPGHARGLTPSTVVCVRCTGGGWQEGELFEMGRCPSASPPPCPHVRACTAWPAGSSVLLCDGRWEGTHTLV